MKNALLIAGTDTDAGKTVLTSALIAYWQRYHPHRSLGVIKPLQTGIGDRELYSRLFDLAQTPEQLNPVHFPDPLAPPVAAAKVGKEIDLGLCWRTFTQLCQQKDWVLVESLGGLGSPITAELIVADLARDWAIPVVLIVPVRLGAIASTVANIALAKTCKLQLRGIILNCTQPYSDSEIADFMPKDLIESLTQTPILGTIPYLENPTDLNKLAQVAAHLDLEYLMSP